MAAMVSPAPFHSDSEVLARRGKLLCPAASKFTTGPTGACGPSSYCPGAHPRNGERVVMIYSKTCGFYDVIRNLTVLKDSMFNDIRPVKDAREITVVTMDFTLYSILDLDMKLQTLKTFGWFTIKWENQYLTWDPTLFCDISRTSVSAASVWRPDLFVYEMTDEDKSPPVNYLYVHSNGTNVRLRPMMIVSTCGIDTFKFPFDTQTCTLTFGSFMYSVKEVVLKAGSDSASVTKLSKEEFASKGDWSLINIEVITYNSTYKGRQWSNLEYKVTIERTPSHYVVTLIVPACFMMLIDLSSMFIPMEGGERLGFKITVVLGFSVLLLILNELLPSSQGTPILEIFCMVCLLLMITSIIAAIFISYLLHQPETRPVPRWMRICILKHLARALSIDTKAVDTKENGETSSNKEIGLQFPNLLPKEEDSTEAVLLKRILFEIIKFQQQMNSTKNGEEKSDWYMVAYVLDKFFVIAYLVTVLIVVCVLMAVWSC